MSSFNQGGLLIDPKFIVLHYTASRTAKSALTWFKNPKSKVSAHFVIDRDGTVIPCVPTNRIAWANGVSSWREYTALNNHAISIELVNQGPVRPVGNTGQYEDFQGNPVPYTEVYKGEFGPYSYWHKYTKEQVTACNALIDELVKKHPTLEELLGHSDISPSRKHDPGPSLEIARPRRLRSHTESAST